MRDYKPRPRGVGRNLAGRPLLGVVIGLVLGLTVASCVQIYLASAPTEPSSGADGGKPAVIALISFAGGAFLYKRGTEPRSVSALTPRPELLVRAHSPILGPPGASVTIVEFFDPACEACRAFHPVVKRIMSAFPGRVRAVVRYATFHDGSEEAVRILETARLQGNFEPVLEALFAAQPVWAAHGAPNLAKAWEAAAAAGLNVAKAKEDMLMPSINAVLHQDMADVRAMDVRQTPTFFVNGKPLPSFGAQELYDLFESEVRATRSGAN